MKSLPRISCQLFRLLLVAAALGAGFGLAQSPTASPGPKQGPSAILRSVKVISDAEGPALEIISTRAANPTIEFLDNPPRLVVDLPDTRVLLPRKRLEVGNEQVSTVRFNQFQQAPPVTRVVVDLVRPVGYSSDIEGERLLVRLHPMAEAKRRTPEPPSVSALTKGVQPLFVPVGSGSSGAVVEAGSRLSGNSAVTAGTDTTVLHLARGGEVRVCPGTTLSVTSSQNGRDLMLGMSTGGLEANYSLNTSADSVVTPDFRMLLAGPGEFHYAFKVDARGDTCVRSLPGNTASVIVSELMGDGIYQVKPNEQIFFRSGKISLTETTVPDDCGCPPPQVPVMRAAALPGPTVSETDLPPAVHLAQPGDEAKPVAPASDSGMTSREASSSQVRVTMAPGGADLPAPPASAAHVQVDAPFVFRASDLPAPAPKAEVETLPMAHSARQVPVITIAEPHEEGKHKGVFGKVKGFFASIFR